MLRIAERISESTISYKMVWNEDTFKLHTIFHSFHHQVKIHISDRVILAGILML